MANNVNVLFISVIVLLAVNGCLSCYLRSCLTKRRSESEQLGVQRPCLSCLGGKGQCVGPRICCHPSEGCVFGGAESEICMMENFMPLCSVHGKVCGSVPNGRCTSKGVCCSDNSCSSDAECE